MPRQRLGLRGTVIRAAVLGRPIAHSLSPVLHRAAYAQLGLDRSYEAIDCGVAELPGVLAARTGWGGFSCTMPLKHAALEVAASIAPAAAAVGAANTLLPAADGWRADNTDVDGVLGALADARVRADAGVTLLGAGGTAQAVVVALARAGAGACDVLVRSPARAAALRATAERAGLTLRVDPLDVSAPALRAPLVISTLPAGAADPLAAAGWSAGQAVLDVVYAGWPTRFAAAASAGGATAVTGAAMLLHQAVRQVELMTGARAGAATVAAMRAALRTAAPDSGV